MIKNLRIPANLDLAQLIEEKLPLYQEKKGGINVLNLAYICHAIISQWYKYKTDHWSKRFERNFVPLRSEILKQIVPQYKNCVRFLRENNIVLCDDFAIPDEKSYGYSLTDEYVGKGYKQIEVKGFLKGQLDAYYSAKEEESKAIIDPIEAKRKHLIGCLLSPKLTIERKAALLEVRNMFREDVAKANYFFKHNKNTRDALIKEAAINRDVNEEIINLINTKKSKNENNKDFYIIDDSGNRLHSPITRLPERLRKHLRFRGEPLVSIDVRNSQPYFSLILLNKEFYKEQSRCRVKLYKIYNDLYKLLLQSEQMDEVRKIVADKKNTVLSDFKQDVINGNLYDKFVTVPLNDPKYKEERDTIKHDFIVTMYDVPRLNMKSPKHFMRAYADVFDLYNAIKKVKTGELKKRNIGSKRNTQPTLKQLRLFTDEQPIGDGFGKSLKVAYPKDEYANHEPQINKYQEIDKGYTMLAILLQRVESHLLLDVACRYIAKQNPNIPLITIHDCIATTPQYVEFVQNTIIAVLKEAIGEQPQFKIEKWGTPLPNAVKV